MNINTKIITVIMLLSSSLFATQNEIFSSKVKAFFKDGREVPLIVSTYTKHNGQMEYAGEKIVEQFPSRPLIYTIKSFDNVENNTSQKALKESFEKLIPDYLEIEELFSKEACKTDVSSNQALPYSDFFRLLQLYTDYLKENAPKDEYYELVEKSLGNFHALMQNSDNLIDYMISLSHMHQLLMSLNCSDEVREMVAKYPPQNPELLFEKLELEKERTLTLWREKGMDKDNVTGYSKERLEKLNEEVTVEFEKILNKMSKLERVAIEDASSESLTRYKSYAKKLTDLSRHNGIWENLKYKGSVYIMRALDFLGIESDFRGTTTDRIVALLSAMMLPHTAEMNSKSYQQHKELVERYDVLLNGCEEK